MVSRVECQDPNPPHFAGRALPAPQLEGVSNSHTLLAKQQTQLDFSMSCFPPSISTDVFLTFESYMLSLTMQSKYSAFFRLFLLI